jgi:hypothetical protein
VLLPNLSSSEMFRIPDYIMTLYTVIQSLNDHAHTKRNLKYNNELYGKNNHGVINETSHRIV